VHLGVRYIRWTNEERLMKRGNRRAEVDASLALFPGK
jgi:hypothetical protein